MSDRFGHWFAVYRYCLMSGYTDGTSIGADKRRRVPRSSCPPRSNRMRAKDLPDINIYGIICFAASSIQRKTDPGMMPSTRREAARTPPQMALPHLGASSGCRASLSWV
jgi:hypothetical protein